MSRNVATLPYALRFGLAYTLLLLGGGLLLHLLAIPAASGIGVATGALLGAALYAGRQFVRKLQRLPSRAERTDLIWQSLLVSMLVSLALAGGFLAWLATPEMLA